MNVGILGELVERFLAIAGKDEIEFAFADTTAEFLANQ